MMRAVRTEIPFGAKMVDAYKLQNHHFEKRLGFAGISTSLGYKKGWLGRLHKDEPEQFKVLLEEGYTGHIVPVRIKLKRGASTAKTLSVRDFNQLLAYEALKKTNINAIILLVAASEAGWERLLFDAFEGKSLDWFGEKIVHYSKWTHEQWEEVMAYNRDDARSLWFWGNPPSLEL